ncbi:hypothetical protein L9F63_022124, partial [Diploptera punctata]
VNPNVRILYKDSRRDLTKAVKILKTKLKLKEITEQLIFSGEYTKAMSKDWHSGHFCCWQCDESLTGQRYVLRDDHPYCIKCYESVFANVCEECNKTIGIDSKDLSYKDKHWHEACFLCNKCRVLWLTSSSGPKQTRSTAETVMMPSSHPDAMAVERSSELEYIEFYDFITFYYVLAEKFETRLHLTTKTVGEDRIKKAKENNEDVAVLSTFLPSPEDGKKKNIFECALKEGCLLGDPKKAIAA